MFLFYMYMVEEVKILTTVIDISKVDLFMTRILQWSEQNWIFLKPVHLTQWFRKMNELGTIQKDGHEEYTCRV